MFRSTIRDVLWLTVVAEMGVGLGLKPLGVNVPRNLFEERGWTT